MRYVLDAGAFIGFDRGDADVRAELAAARQLGVELVTTSPVIAQAWRDGRRQAMLARLISSTRVEAPDEGAAKEAGLLLAKSKTSDVVDALLVGLLRDDDFVLTSDREDLEVLIAARRARANIIDV